MAENKRQHYVPQFYLRNFAAPGQSVVGVYNIASGRLIRQAGVKTQACGSYFYGKDDLAERQLGLLEDKMSQAIAKVVKSGLPPKIQGEDHFKLVYFMMLQSARTARAKAEYEARLDVVAKSLIRQQYEGFRPDIIAGLDRVRITQEDAIVRAMNKALVGAPAAYDLAFKLLVNETSIPFITSDHPIARHNQLLEGPAELSTVAIGLAGLQIFIPLSPRLMLLFYDDYAYAVGSVSSRSVRINRPNHVQQINLLQWYEAEENIFLPSNAAEADVRALAAQAAAWGPRGNEWVEEIVVERSETQKRVRTIHRAPPRPMRLTLPFIRLRGPRPNITGADQLPMRFPEWMAHLHELSMALQKGEISEAMYQVATAKIPYRTKAQRRV